MNTQRLEERGESAVLRWLGEEWAAKLAEVLESMTGVRPEAEWHPSVPRGTQELIASGLASEGWLWWEQSYNFLPGVAGWAGLPKESWSDFGTRTLRSAGIEDAEVDDIRNTCLELLSQSFSALAQALTERKGEEVVSVKGGESSGPLPDYDFSAVLVKYPDRMLPPIAVAFNPAFIEGLEDSKEISLGAPADAHTDQSMPPAVASKTLDFLLDVELPVSISFGKAQLPLQDVLKLTAGSVVELDRSIQDPVELIVNGHVIALGEVVVVEGNYGVRILEIINREEGLWTDGELSCQPQRPGQGRIW